MKVPVWDLKSQYEHFQEQDVFDCMIAEYLLSEGKYQSSEDEAMTRRGAESLHELYEKQQTELHKNPKLMFLFEQVEMPLVGVLWRMERAGIRVDRDQLTKLGERLSQEIGDITNEIHQAAGQPFNIASPQQVGKMLVDTFKVPLPKKASGQFSTGEQELTKVADKFPIAKKVLKFRELSKLKSTYIEPLISKVADDGRVHTTYSQALVATGRLSSANPNMQNIPVSGEIGKLVKRGFIADPGNILVSFDYSQQELRILAHLTEEPNLIEAFRKGQDVHRVTASQLFDVDYDKVNKEQRHIAKTTNFGIVYGMGSFGMAQTLNIPQEQASKFIKEFDKTFPKIKSYYETYLKDGIKNGYVETILGRRRYVDSTIDNASRRVLINFPIQGSAADLTKKAMVSISRELLQKREDIKMLLQIHDDLVFEVKKGVNLKQFVAEVKNIMNHVYDLSVPIEVDAKSGTNWGEMEPL